MLPALELALKGITQVLSLLISDSCSERHILGPNASALVVGVSDSPEVSISLSLPTLLFPLLVSVLSPGAGLTSSCYQQVIPEMQGALPWSC